MQARKPGVVSSRSVSGIGIQTASTSFIQEFTYLKIVTENINAIFRIQFHGGESVVITYYLQLKITESESEVRKNINQF